MVNERYRIILVIIFKSPAQNPPVSIWPGSCKRVSVKNKVLMTGTRSRCASSRLDKATGRLEGSCSTPHHTKNRLQRVDARLATYARRKSRIHPLCPILCFYDNQRSRKGSRHCQIASLHGAPQGAYKYIGKTRRAQDRSSFTPIAIHTNVFATHSQHR